MERTLQRTASRPVLANATVMAANGEDPLYQGDVRLPYVPSVGMRVSVRVSSGRPRVYRVTEVVRADRHQGDWKLPWDIEIVLLPFQPRRGRSVGRRQVRRAVDRTQ